MKKLGYIGKKSESTRYIQVLRGWVVARYKNLIKLNIAYLYLLHPLSSQCVQHALINPISVILVDVRIQMKLLPFIPFDVKKSTLMRRTQCKSETRTRQLLHKVFYCYSSVAPRVNHEYI